MLRGRLRSRQPDRQVEVDPALRLGRVVGGGQGEGAQLELGTDREDLADGPRPLHVHAGLAVGEGEVAVGVVLGDRVLVEIRCQAEHLLAGRGEILLERHRRIGTEVGGLASELPVERRDIDHAACRVIEQTLLRGPGVPVGLVNRHDALGLELLAHREEFGPGGRDGGHADLVEQVPVVDDALGGHRVGQHARLALERGVLGDQSLDVRVDGLGLRQVGQVGQHAPGDEDGRGQVVVVAVDGGRITAHELRDQAGGEVVGHHHLRLARVELGDQVVEVRNDLGFRLLEHDPGGPA